MTKHLQHHEIKAKLFEDEYGPAVLLTQTDGWDQPPEIIVHPSQLREVCERFGILTADIQAEKTIATLKRRLQSLRNRINDLTEYMATHSEQKHVALTYEMVNIIALSEMADEWCVDFVDATPLNAEPAQCTGAPVPATQGSLI